MFSGYESCLREELGMPSKRASQRRNGLTTLSVLGDLGSLPGMVGAQSFDLVCNLLLH